MNMTEFYSNLPNPYISDIRNQILVHNLQDVRIRLFEKLQM